jgi:hypothetical protein
MGINDNRHVYNYYDRIKGWDQTSPGWYEVILHIENPPETIKRYEDTIQWIYDNIQGYHKHCRWHYAGNYLKYKFRHEKDYLWFKLRWG